MKLDPPLRAFVNGLPAPGAEWLPSSATRPGPVIWAILHDRSTQHAVQLEELGEMTTRLIFACMNNRHVDVEAAMVRLLPWSLDEAVLCKRHWCRNHWYEQTSIPDVDRARMRNTLLKIENELVEPGTLS